MAEPKTRPTGASVPDFLAAIPGEERREDCRALDRMMRRISGTPARMWGPSIVGYGSFTKTYADGRTLDWPALAFSPRVQALTLYVMVDKSTAALLPKLGKHKMSDVCCLYIRRLVDVDLDVLTRVLEQSQELAGRGSAPAAGTSRSSKAAAHNTRPRAARAAAPARRATGARKVTGKRGGASTRSRTASRAR